MCTNGVGCVYQWAYDGGLLYKGWLCVPMVEELRNEVLKEVNNSPFAMHPRATKMHQDIMVWNEEGYRRVCE